MGALANGGWLPVPHSTLPFCCIVAASRSDPLASYALICALARALGSRLMDLGVVVISSAHGFGD